MDVIKLFLGRAINFLDKHTSAYLKYIPAVFMLALSFFIIEFPIYCSVGYYSLTSEVAVRVLLCTLAMLWLIADLGGKMKTYAEKVAVNLLAIELILLNITIRYSHLYYWWSRPQTWCVLCVAIGGIILFVIKSKKSGGDIKAKEMFGFLFRKSLVIASVSLLSVVVLLFTNGYSRRLIIANLTGASTRILSEANYEAPRLYDNAIFSILPMLNEETWQSSSTEVRICALKNLADIESDYLLTMRVNSINLADLDEDISCVYLPYFNEMFIDEKDLQEKTASEWLQIICHNIYHVCEHDIANDIDFTDDTVKKSYYYAKAKEWWDYFEAKESEAVNDGRLSREEDAQIIYIYHKDSVIEDEAVHYAESRAEYYAVQFAEFNNGGSAGQNVFQIIEFYMED